MLIVREEDVGRSERHEMAKFQPYKNSVTGLPLQVPTSQDVGSVAHPIVSGARTFADVSKNI
jgi:hypothetical protein